MSEEERKQALLAFMDEKRVNKLLKLIRNYDNYVGKFKKSVNKMLEPHNLELKFGMSIVPKQNDTGE